MRRMGRRCIIQKGRALSDPPFNSEAHLTRCVPRSMAPSARRRKLRTTNYELRTTNYELPTTNYQLVAVVLRLIRSLDRHAEVVRLLLRQLRQLDAEVIEVQPCDLFVQRLRQHRHRLAVLLGVGVQLELRQRLVGERR